MSSKIVAPRGTQDLLPSQTRAWQSLESAIHDLARRYGYGEIRTPIFEATELFVRGVGETTDIVEKEMYTFVDKGGRSMTLRPEFTAPVMRAVLQQNLLANGSSRLYYTGPIFRYERPQAGRYRQAHQFGIECIGYAQPEADVEVIAMAAQLMRARGITGVQLHLNTIGDAACRPQYRDALLAHFRPHAASLSEDSRRRLERNPLRILDSKAPEDRPFIATAPRQQDLLCDACRAHFEAVQQYLIAMGIPFIVDTALVRGLDYYTRTVFEFVSDALGAQSTVCAGGRYDGLVRELGGPQTPAVGFALGIERLLLVEAASGGEAAAPREGVQAIALGAEARARLVPVVAAWRERLRAPVFMEYDDRKLLAQLKSADRNGARYAVIVGSDELAADEMILRDLEARSDARLPFGGDPTAPLVEG